MATRGKKDSEPGAAAREAAQASAREVAQASAGEAAQAPAREVAQAPARAEPAPAPEKRSRSRGATESEPPAGWIEGLDEVVPGFSILDRELVFEGGARADLAGVDPSGRLHLVLLAGQDVDRVTLEVLDLIGVLRTQMEILVRHLGEGRVNPERSARVLVVSSKADAKLVARLEPLREAGVIALGMRTVKSAAGKRSYLIRLDDDAAPGAREGVATFLRALPGRLETLGTTLMERMERLDEELTPSGDSTTLVWRLADEVLCRVERVGDLLQASVAPRHEPMPLSDMADLENLVEAALARLVRVLGLTRGGQGEGRALQPGPDEPILTPEEIEAFRQ